MVLEYNYLYWEDRHGPEAIVVSSDRWPSYITRQSLYLHNINNIENGLQTCIAVLWSSNNTSTCWEDPRGPDDRSVVGLPLYKNNLLYLHNKTKRGTNQDIDNTTTIQMGNWCSVPSKMISYALLEPRSLFPYFIYRTILSGLIDLDPHGQYRPQLSQNNGASIVWEYYML